MIVVHELMFLKLSATISDVWKHLSCILYATTPKTHWCEGFVTARRKVKVVHEAPKS